MSEFFSNPAVMALIATIFGGAGLKIIEHWLSKSKTRADSAMEMRNELRLDLARLREDLAAVRKESEDLEHELDTWKTKYYDLMKDFIKIKADLDRFMGGKEGP